MHFGLNICEQILVDWLGNFKQWNTKQSAVSCSTNSVAMIIALSNEYVYLRGDESIIDSVFVSCNIYFGDNNEMICVLVLLERK